jgi:hypothetical protein
MLEARLAGHRNVVVWPEEPSDIPDREPCFLVAYLPLEFAAKPSSEQVSVAKSLLEKFGEKPRCYRNGLGLAIPAGDQVEILRRAVRYLLAIEGVKSKARQLNLTDEQKSQLREREFTEKAAAESALLKLYSVVWLPRAEAGGLEIEKIAVGGRPLQVTLNAKKEAMIHERIVELITQVQRRVFDKTEPGRIVELFKLGEGNPPKLGIATVEMVDGFYSFLGFPRLMTTDAIRKGIAKGVQEGHFGYYSGPKPELGPDGTFQVALNKVRFKVPVSEGELDLESGFLMVPQAIPQPKPIEGPDARLVPPGSGGAIGPGVKGGGGGTLPPPGGPGGSPAQPPPVADRTVDLTFSTDRNGLYAAWSAIANLADMAGRVTVAIHAESEKGFDKMKLQNGVLEPLREADLID